MRWKSFSCHAIILTYVWLSVNANNKTDTQGSANLTEITSRNSTNSTKSANSNTTANTSDINAKGRLISDTSQRPNGTTSAVASKPTTYNQTLIKYSNTTHPETQKTPNNFTGVQITDPEGRGIKTTKVITTTTTTVHTSGGSSTQPDVNSPTHQTEATNSTNGGSTTFEYFNQREDTQLGSGKDAASHGGENTYNTETFKSGEIKNKQQGQSSGIGTSKHGETSTEEEQKSLSGTMVSETTIVEEVEETSNSEEAQSTDEAKKGRLDKVKSVTKAPKLVTTDAKKDKEKINKLKLPKELGKNGVEIITKIVTTTRKNTSHTGGPGVPKTNTKGTRTEETHLENSQDTDQDSSTEENSPKANKKGGSNGSLTSKSSNKSSINVFGNSDTGEKKKPANVTLAGSDKVKYVKNKDGDDVNRTTVSETTIVEEVEETSNSEETRDTDEAKKGRLDQVKSVTKAPKLVTTDAKKDKGKIDKLKLPKELGKNGVEIITKIVTTTRKNTSHTGGPGFPKTNTKGTRTEETNLENSQDPDQDSSTEENSSTANNTGGSNGSLTSKSSSKSSSNVFGTSDDGKKKKTANVTLTGSDEVKPIENQDGDDVNRTTVSETITVEEFEETSNSEEAHSTDESKKKKLDQGKSVTKAPKLVTSDSKKIDKLKLPKEAGKKGVEIITKIVTTTRKNTSHTGGPGFPKTHTKGTRTEETNLENSQDPDQDSSTEENSSTANNTGGSNGSLTSKSSNKNSSNVFSTSDTGEKKKPANVTLAGSDKVKFMKNKDGDDVNRTTVSETTIVEEVEETSNSEEVQNTDEAKIGRLDQAESVTKAPKLVTTNAKKDKGKIDKLKLPKELGKNEVEIITKIVTTTRRNTSHTGGPGFPKTNTKGTKTEETNVENSQDTDQDSSTEKNLSTANNTGKSNGSFTSKNSSKSSNNVFGTSDDGKKKKPANVTLAGSDKEKFMKNKDGDVVNRTTVSETTTVEEVEEPSNSEEAHSTDESKKKKLDQGKSVTKAPKLVSSDSKKIDKLKLPKEVGKKGVEIITKIVKTTRKNASHTGGSNFTKTNNKGTKAEETHLENSADTDPESSTEENSTKGTHSGGSHVSYTSTSSKTNSSDVFDTSDGGNSKKTSNVEVAGSNKIKPTKSKGGDGINKTMVSEATVEETSNSEEGVTRPTEKTQKGKFGKANNKTEVEVTTTIVKSSKSNVNHNGGSSVAGAKSSTDTEENYTEDNQQVDTQSGTVTKATNANNAGGTKTSSTNTKSSKSSSSFGVSGNEDASDLSEGDTSSKSMSETSQEDTEGTHNKNRVHSETVTKYTKKDHQTMGNGSKVHKYKGSKDAPNSHFFEEFSERSEMEEADRSGIRKHEEDDDTSRDEIGGSKYSTVSTYGSGVKRKQKVDATGPPKKFPNVNPFPGLKIDLHFGRSVVGMVKNKTEKGTADVSKENKSSEEEESTSNKNNTRVNNGGFSGKKKISQNNTSSESSKDPDADSDEDEEGTSTKDDDEKNAKKIKKHSNSKVSPKNSKTKAGTPSNKTKTAVITETVHSFSEVDSANNNSDEDTSIENTTKKTTRPQQSDEDSEEADTDASDSGSLTTAKPKKKKGSKKFTKATTVTPKPSKKPKKVRRKSHKSKRLRKHGTMFLHKPSHAGVYSYEDGGHLAWAESYNYYPEEVIYYYEEVDDSEEDSR